jgi:hypothetical protein
MARYELTEFEWKVIQPLGFGYRASIRFSVPVSSLAVMAQNA